MSRLHDHKIGKIKEQERIAKTKEKVKKNKKLYEEMFGESTYECNVR